MQSGMRHDDIRHDRAHGACIGRSHTQLFDGTVGRDCKVGGNVIASRTHIMASRARVDGITKSGVFVRDRSLVKQQQFRSVIFLYFL